MSEVIIPVLLKDVNIDNSLKYYGNSFYCSNCGQRNHRWILKGRKISEQSFECDKCGCIIDGKKVTPNYW